MRYFSFLTIIFLLAACGTAKDPNAPRAEFATDGQTRALSVIVPPNWVSIQESNDSLSLANSEGAMTRYALGFPALEAGDMAGSVNSLLKLTMPPEVENTPEGVTAYILDIFTYGVEAMNYNFGTPQSLEIAGQAAIEVEGLGIDERELENPNDNIVIELRLLVLDAGEGYGIFFFGAAPYELEPYLETWHTIAETFRFQSLVEAN